MKRLVPFAVLVLMVAASCAPAPTATPVPPTAVPVQPTVAPTQPPATTSAPAVAPTTAPTVAPTQAPTKAPTAAPTATSIRSSITGSGCHLILSTTTSTQDSGLLDFILPDFQKKFNCKVDAVAVGTGQAIAIGQKGDADVLLVHDRKAEDQFVADGHAKERLDVMYNDFILVGPKSDPAKVSGMKAAKDAFKVIMDAKATFASRGDKSGTNTKELSIWSSLAITPTKEMAWYNALGQGMGDTLLFSNEKQAYTLTDRATWLATQAKLPNLVVVVGGNNIKENADKDLLNPYGVIAVDPTKHPGVNFDMATNFVKWITSVEEQKVINQYGVDKYGQQLFYASSKEYLQSK
jgi:tungstate transport system substrate-binding protein